MFKIKQLSVYLILSIFISTPVRAVKIGVIVPMQHTAMEEIVAGLQETLKPYLSESDEIIVKNANGDQTLQHQIIKQMLNSGVDYFLPIGTSTSLMTLSIVKSKPVICIAAVIDPETFQKISLERVGVINDEIEVSHLLQFIKNYMPEIKNLGLIYSNSEKIFPEIKQAQDFCQKNSLSLVLRKVDSIAEVYQFSQSLLPQVDAILILKDHTVVSAVSGLVSLAKKHKKLVISMDDGSVKNGAHFGLGVRERDIGIAAAKSLIEALQGNKNKAFKITTLDNFSIFYNQNSMLEQTLFSLDQLKDATKTMDYSFECVSDGK
jgi:putative ABC transport system substrate-binding protein